MGLNFEGFRRTAKENIRRTVQNTIPDLRDAKTEEFAPASAMRELARPEDSLPFADRLFEPETRAAILAEAASLGDGEYKASIMAGTKEKATLHPHDYYLKKEGSRVQIYFIDPEHAMGKHKRLPTSPLIRSGDFRPPTVTLSAVEIAEDTVPKLSMLWYRAPAVPHITDLKMKAQYEVAKQMMERDSELPDLLKGKGNEITFHFVTRPNMMLAQGRYTNIAELKQFMYGTHDVNEALEGKAHAMNIIMRRALRLMREGAFKLQTGPRVESAKEDPDHVKSAA